jgi:hypothetical protein
LFAYSQADEMADKRSKGVFVHVLVWDNFVELVIRPHRRSPAVAIRLAGQDSGALQKPLKRGQYCSD